MTFRALLLMVYLTPSISFGFADSWSCFNQDSSVLASFVSNSSGNISNFLLAKVEDHTLPIGGMPLEAEGNDLHYLGQTDRGIIRVHLQKVQLDMIRLAVYTIGFTETKIVCFRDY